MYSKVNPPYMSNVRKFISPTKYFLLASLLFFFGCKEESWNESPLSPAGQYFLPDTITSTAKQVYLWQKHNMKGGNPNNGWARSVFYIGISAAYTAFDDSVYLKDCLAWGESNQWQPGPRPRHADEHTCGQVYTEMYLNERNREMIEPIRQQIDMMIASPKLGREDWHWCDALFMAPPTIARLGDITQDQQYFDYMATMWADVTEYLYSEEDSLFYRDIRYPDLATPEGNSVFWSRGNGWVIAGIIRVLQYFPGSHPYYSSLIDLYRRMAYRLINLQRTDGLWSSSLLDSEDSQSRETSGAALFCYAMAWGVNQGILEKNHFERSIREAWVGLNESVGLNGRLGWVQQSASEPGKVGRDDYQEYGAGAFLLAATEIYRLIQD